MSIWADITQDPKTGHTVAKDLFKAIAFAVGTGVVAFGAYADYKAGRPIDQAGAVILLSFALGTAVQKSVEGYFNRKTADDAGNPLAVPPPESTPPPLMPQAPTNAEEAGTQAGSQAASPGQTPTT